MPTALVLFCRGADRRTLSQWVTLARRSPKLAKYAAICRLAEIFMTGHEFAHVSVSDGEVVLDVRMGSIQPWPESWYLQHERRLTMYFRVPYRGNMDLDRYEHQRSIDDSVVRNIAHGQCPTLVRGRSCVTIVADCLNRVGVEVPRWVATPHQMFDHIRSQGHELVCNMGIAADRDIEDRARSAFDEMQPSSH